jgi:cell division protein FtsW
MLRYRTGRPDMMLFVLAVLLVAVGLVFIYSASYPKAHQVKPDQPALYLIRQALYAGFGLVGFFVMAYLPLSIWRLRWMPPLLLGITLVALGLCFIPPVGTDLGRQAWRWIRLGPLLIQCSELAKLVVVLYLAFFLSEKKPEQLATFQQGLLPALTVVGGILLLILLQPHLGAVLVIGGTALVLLFVGGIPWRQLGALLGVGTVLVGVAIFLCPYRKERFEAWINPLSDPQNRGYHAIHHGTALARGGVTGRGFIESIEKFFYLPECYSDSILAIIGEEMGLVGTLTLLFLLFSLAYRGFNNALHCPEPYHKLLGVGLSSLILTQSLLNYAVVTNTLPQTGMGLPFISYGGTSLVCHLAAVGLLFNLSSYAVFRRPQPALKAESDPSW